MNYELQVYSGHFVWVGVAIRVCGSDSCHVELWIFDYMGWPKSDLFSKRVGNLQPEHNMFIKRVRNLQPEHNMFIKQVDLTKHV